MWSNSGKHLVERQTQKMRRIMWEAMGDAHGRRREPEIVRAKRMVRHWQKEVRDYVIPPGYWDALSSTLGKQVPISLMRRVPEKYGVGCPAADAWVFCGDRYDRALQVWPHWLPIRSEWPFGATRPIAGCTFEVWINDETRMPWMH